VEAAHRQRARYARHLGGCTLSSGGDKRTHWERLLAERKLGALALLRNLRNMKDADVPESQVVAALDAMRTDRVLPFRFLAAARHAPQWEEALERAMFRSLEGTDKLAGHTVILVDVSGSMVAPLSRRSQMLRTDAAYGLAVLLREIAEKVTVYTFSNSAKRIPPRRGFALRDAMESSQPHSGTYLGAALDAVEERYDRIIVITDEQSHDRVGAPRGKGYMINAASARNGVGYGPWIHIDGFSEAVINYIRELENVESH
jgi:60 kDa SS-A/Ro ribonucleoprotein